MSFSYPAELGAAARARIEAARAAATRETPDRVSVVLQVYEELLVALTEAVAARWDTWTGEQLRVVSDRALTELIDDVYENHGYLLSREYFAEQVRRRLRTLPLWAALQENIGRLAARDAEPEPADSTQRELDFGFPQRAAWLRREMSERRVTVHGLAEKLGGPSKRSTKRILAGHEVHSKVLDKLRDALLKAAPERPVGEIPRR